MKKDDRRQGMTAPGDTPAALPPALMPAVQRVALALLLALLPLLPVLAGKTFPWQALLVVGVVAGAVLLWLAGEWQGLRRDAAASRPIAPDLIDLALGLFVLLQLLSWFPSVYRFASAVYGAKVVAFAAIFWLLRYGLRDRAWWRAGLWCLVAGGMLLAVLGLQEYVRTVRFMGGANWRVFGPMFNPNIAAGYLLLTIFPALALLLGWQSRGSEAPQSSEVGEKPPAAASSGARRSGPSSDRPGRRPKRAAPPPEDTVAEAPRYAEIAGLFCALLIFFTVLLTGSKGALGALLVAAVVFAWAGFRGQRGRLVRLGILAFVAVTILLAFALPPLRVRLLSAFGGQSHSTIFRGYTWQATVKMIEARPLTGFGGGTFENILPRYAIAGYTRAAHQSFLQIAAECGLPALLAGLAFGTLLLIALYRRARDSAEALPRLVAAAALAGLLASCIQQLADYAWYVPAVGVAFFALAGLALSPVGPPEAVIGRPLRLPARWRRTALLAAACANLVLLLWTARAQYAELLGAQASAEIAAQDYGSAAITLRRAAAVNPAQAQFAVQQAKVDEALAGQSREALQSAVAARLQAIRLQPTEPVNYLALSRLYEEGGDLRAALQATRQALAWYPTYPRGLAQLVRLQQRLGDRAGALATARRLIAVYHSPVGQYPPVTDLIETAYAQGWLLLGDEARRQKNETEALSQYRQAAALLASAVSSERGYSASMAAAGEGPWGHLEENTQVANELLQRLQQSDRPVAVKLMVELQEALGEKEEAERLLRYLSQQPPASPSARLAAAWALLERAKLLPADRQEEAAALAKKGLPEAQQALAGAVPEAAAAEGWLAEDTAALRDLMQKAATPPAVSATRTP